MHSLHAHIYTAQKWTAQIQKPKTDSNTSKYSKGPKDLLTLHQYFNYNIYKWESKYLTRISERKHKWHDMNPISKLAASSGLLNEIERIQGSYCPCIDLICSNFIAIHVLQERNSRAKPVLKRNQDCHHQTLSPSRSPRWKLNFYLLYPNIDVQTGRAMLVCSWSVYMIVKWLTCTY